VVLAFAYTDASCCTCSSMTATSPLVAGQRLVAQALNAIKSMDHDQRMGPVSSRTHSAMRQVLRTQPAAFKELVLTLSSETYLAEQLDVDPQHIHTVQGSAAPCSWPLHCTRTG
jgi:aminopeptidase N